MAASQVEENLLKLKETLGGSAAQKEHASVIVADLNQLCTQEASDKDIDVICSSIFHKEYGVTAFLSKAVTNDELQAVKGKLLDFLYDFIEKVGKKVLPYAVEIKDVCVSLFSRDRFAKVKNAALPVLSMLLELTVGTSMGKDLQIDKLINKFFTELTKTTKLAATVREKIYVLLGIVAEVYPEYMVQYSERLTSIYLNSLKAEMNSKTRKPELSIISGCLEGLSYSLVNFTQSSDEDSTNSYEIFKYARMAIDPKVDLTRYDVPRAGLKVFARHASQFRQFLIDDYENVYMKMSHWSHHKNRDMLLIGMQAMEAFLTQIADTLKEKAKDGKQGRIFKYFVCQFQEIMQNESASDKELSLAIRGYGLLAGPCRCFMKEADVQFMFVKMLTKTEQQFLSNSEDIEDRLFNMPSYLESLASIVREMDTVSDTHVQSLEHLMVLLLENMPSIHKAKHFMCQRALLWILLSIMPKGSSFRQLLSGFIFQGLIRTCSYTPVVETENNESDVTPEDMGIKKITYVDFMGTWKGLLDAALIKDFAAADISLETRNQLTDVVYNEIMLAIMKVLDKLDLSASTATDENSELPIDDSLASADPLTGVQANRPRDYQVFINLVDFCKDLLPNKHYKKFECWLFTFTHKLILMSSEHPLASGLYKLLAVTMKVANKINYFKDVGSVHSPVKKESQTREDDSERIKEEPMDVDTCSRAPNVQKSTCQQLVKKFSKEVLVRMKQYRDDLLASCLTFILALPKEIISEQMADVVPAIQVTLSLGVSYLPLAMVAMDALESWYNSLPSHVMMPFYTSILPCLDSFLKTSEKGAEEVDTNVSTNKSKSVKGRKKLAIRLIKGRKDRSAQGSVTELSQVKQRVIQYLGRLGGSVNYVLLSKMDEESAAKAIAWDEQEHLKFEMPFIDMKPTIYLDPFLPHVTELASQSSDRQTKVAACELLHSLILYSIGRGAQQPGAKIERASMAPLYKKVFPVMLKLACDVEQVAQQLFEPLMMQVIHWFTNNKKSESEETISLLDAIYEGMIQQTDTAVRDFSARCLHEFLKWSIKQSSAKASETNPTNAKSVLKRLYSYALHPSPFKRLGAALAFNNIYTVFREEEPLVNMFTFELLVHFVESLAIAHGDEKSLGTQEQCCKSLEHLEKIIRHKADLLKVPNKNRKQPKSWTSITLDIAVRWLSRQCGRPQTECRHVCMKLAFQLAPLLKGVKTPVAFFQACLKGKGPKYWIERFEGGGHTGSEKRGIEGAATLVEPSDVFSLQTTLAWFDNLLAALDCYTWVFGENLLSPGDLFKGKGSAGTHIFTSIEFFLKNIAHGDIYGAASLFPQKQDDDFFTPKEVEDFNRAKCTVIIRVMNFFTVLLAKYKKDTLAVVPKQLWGKELWELMFSCVVQPKDVCFNLGDVEVMKNLPQEMAQTLGVFTMTFKAEMVKHFTKSLTGERNLLAHLPLSLVDQNLDFFNMQQMLSGYNQLLQVDLLLPCLPGAVAERTANQLLENVFNGIVNKSKGSVTSVTLMPGGVSVAKEMLKLAFSLGLPAISLIECAFDTTPVIGGTDKSLMLQHGDLFFSVFKSSICHYSVSRITDVVSLVVKKVEDDPRRVGSLLTATLDHVCKDRELRKKEGANVLTAVLTGWSNLSCWWSKTSTQDDQGMAILILTKLLLIDSKFTSTPSHPAFTEVFSMYQSLLTDTRTSLAFKCRVLDLLPFFANVTEPHTVKLKSCLDRLVADKFPLRSSELPKGSTKYNDYIAALDRILSAFSLSGSLMLLEYLISIFCREPEHVHEEAIQGAISKFTKRLPRNKQKSAVDVPFNIFAKAGGFPSEIRRATIERVCLPMLRLVQKSSLVEFFLDHISQIKGMLEGKLNKSVEGVLEGQLTSRIGCFQLLEVMYSRLHKEEVVGMSSTINRAFSDGNVQTGKELTSFVSKTAHEAKGEDTRGEATLIELRRQYHCAAYNLMAAFISRTQNEQKYYTAFLFEEKETKGQFLLENLIDKTRSYEFPVELMSPLERKKKFVSIHKELKEKQRDEDDESMEDVEPSYHLASQYLADSSLSEEMSQYYSLTSSAASLASTSSRRRVKAARGSEEEGEDVEMSIQEDYIELELDELNKHECMAALIAVLKHMTTNKISPEVKEGTKNPPMPSWMEKLHHKMSVSSTHHNIKLFIAKLIINTAQIFQPYACHWFQPLTQLVITGPLASGSINYFVMDLVVTMLSWHQTAIPQDTDEAKAMVSRLAHFVIRNIFHETRQVFRNNLEMLKTLLECWKPRIQLPYQEIYSQFHKGDQKGKENLVGIQVLGVILACTFSPYGPSAPVDREVYLSKLANNMGNTHKQVYAAAAEVCGMIFKYLAEKADEREGSFHTHVSSLMMGLHKARPDNFITCVHKMQKHYPPIADRFVNKLLYMLPSLHGEFRPLSLEVILSRIDNVENVYMELKSKGIEACLNHRDEATQLVSLKLVKAILPKLKSTELAVLLPLVTAFGSHSSNGCRTVMYDILMWVYDNYRDESSPEADKILLQTKESLLKGLGDTDIVCRLHVQNFWSSATRLPEGTLDRLVAMLEAMYSPVTEQQYLSYATNLLLEMTTKSPDYQREIFELPLSECKFSDYSVKSSWRQRHAAMTPLFATQSQSQMETDDTVDGIRATQDAQQFTQTMDPGAHKGPFNWLTQSSLDTYADSSLATMETATTQSSLMFSLGTGDMSARTGKRAKPGPGFGKQRMLAVKPSTSAKSDKKEGNKAGNELLRLKRRFIKDSEHSKIFFAKRQTRIKEMREKAVQEQRIRRENQVTMYRKYRTGDLPDIQIKHSYIIAPLQALAHRDNTVAKLLFCAIFKAIFDGMEEVKTESEVTENIRQINKSLNSVLSMSTQYFSPFIGCILDIAYRLRSKLQVTVDNVGASALFSKLQPLGIVVLEESLILDEAVEPRAVKRARMETPVSKDVPQWIELSRLYKSMEEYDVLLGIFSGKIGTQSITQDAVQAEARGDYSTAVKIYEEGLKCQDWGSGSGPLDAETDLWEDCKMDCLQNLCKWSDLEKLATAVVDDGQPPNLSKIWDDTYLQEHFLPFILKGKVKQMLQGDEGQQSLLDFIDAAMKVPDHRLVLENHYSEDLALMYLWQEDFDRARHYCNNALNFFLQEWSSTDSLMLGSRTRTLQKLQPLIELQEFLTFVADEGNFRSLAPAKSLVKEWGRRNPHALTDPVSIWDDVVTNRTVYLDLMSSRLQKMDDSQDSIDDDGDIFLDTKLKLKLKMAESCKEQNNFSLTLRLLKDTCSLCKKSDNPTLMSEWTHLYAGTHHRKVLSSLDPWSCDKLTTLITTLDELGKIEETEGLASSPGLSRHHHVLCGQGFELVAQGLQKVNLKDIEKADKLSQKLLEYTGLKKLDKQVLIEQLLSTGYQKMKAALSVEDGRGTSHHMTFGQADANLATANYCDKILRMKEDDEIVLTGGTLDALPETVVICLLKAMKLDSREAMQRFPRLLQIVEMYSGTMSTFISKSGQVPCWMFLLWISQMLAILDKPESLAVHKILEQLAEHYPQAVVYPLKLSSEGYTFGSGKADKMNKAMLDKLNQLLSPARVPLTDRFISALECFGQPDQDIKELFEEIMQNLRKGKKDKMKELYQSMYTKIMDYKSREVKSQSVKGSSTAEGDESLVAQATGLDIGSYARKFADKFKSEFDKKFGEDGRKMLGMSLRDFNTAKVYFNNLFAREVKTSLSPPEKLSEYSKWMANFNSNIYGRGLEIPGQYTGLCKPQPEYHVKISGFDQRVKVMASIRKPKRICIRGNDEKEYMYLVKGGEDLRQDQRIEQLFYIMNQVLSKDPACNQRKLTLKTYQVIPMTPRVGLIEWVSSTIPLKDFIMNSLTDHEKKFHDSTKGPHTTYQGWLGRVGKKDDGWPVKFAAVFKQYSYSETKLQFSKTEEKVPWDLMRRSFQRLSTSPEAFHVLRTHCMKSHALLSMCQYILGIGDRHLSNFMVNLNTGEMVGIDFGHAFGSATQFLPVPELLPFRLTRQLRNLMLPLDVKGLVENTMIHVLRALRSDSDLLLNTMDIFIKEPSLDWQQFAERQAQSMTDTDSERMSQEGGILEMYPKEKIRFVKRKLKGDNACYINRDELRLGHGKKPAFKDYEKVMLGQPDSVRQQLPAEGLSVEQQVAALIDQATDPNILGRTWIGWEPYV